MAQAKALHGHDTEDGITCVFFSQCIYNDDLSIWKSNYQKALKWTGDSKRASRMAEAYAQGRLTAQMVGVR